MPPAVRLPTVRKLAADLGLAVNTVARSYRELELAGLLETRGRNGTFVASGPSASRQLAVREAREFAQRMRDLGVGDAELLAILRREVERNGASGVPPSKPAP
jgi:DNA-binding transcriptional regulator YhcF (GntR family)